MKSRIWSLSPLTDPRSLVGTLAFHVVLLATGWLVVVSVGQITPPKPAPLIRGELGTVDNRATPEPGGGAPGPRGGTGAVDSEDLGVEGRATLNPVAESLLADVMPQAASPRELRGDRPIPSTAGVGDTADLGGGGGGGVGQGSGLGVGRGAGATTEFFGARETASSFAYVIDCSGSMAVHRALEVAKAELWSSLKGLEEGVQFSVIFYNLYPKVLMDASGQQSLMRANPANKSRIRELLTAVQPDGGTDHLRALKAALELRPEVVFFLTDADLMTVRDVQEILSLVGRTRIQAIEFGVGPDLNSSVPLRKLASATGGTYRYLDVAQFSERGRR